IRSTHEHGLAPNGPRGQRIIAVSYRARAHGKSAQLPLGHRSAPFESLPRVARGWLFFARPYWRSERVDSPARKGGQRQIDANAESARGIAPRAAHGTGHDTLASSGSCHRKKAAAFH